MKKLASLLALITISWSCEKEIDYQIPDPGEKIVVSAELVDGEIPKVYLSTSVYSMSAASPKTSDIYTGWLFSNHPDSPFKLEAKLDSNSFRPQYYYTTSHEIKAGKAYRIEANAPNLDPISSSVIIPPVSPIQNLIFDSITREITFNLLDKVGVDNYYYIEIRDQENDYQLIYSTADPILEFFGFSSDFLDGDQNGRNFGPAAYFDDNSFKNDRKQVSIRLEEFNVLNRDFYVYLYSISESMYRFRLTKAANGFGDEIFSEPVQLYSNVEGGYGILSAKSSSRSLVRY